MMLTRAVIVSGFAAAALAAAHPAVTPAAVRRDLGDDLGDLADNIGEDIKSKAGDLGDDIQSKAGDIGDEIKSKAGEAGDNIESFADNVKDKVTEAFDDVKTKLGDWADNIGDEASALFSCGSGLFVAMTEAPFPTNTDLISAMASAFDKEERTDACIGQDMPESLSAEYSKYESSAVSWYNEHSGAVSTALESCSSLPTGISDLAQAPCPTAPGLLKQGEDGDKDDDEDAAPRLAGYLASAAAIAIGAGAILL